MSQFYVEHQGWMRWPRTLIMCKKTGYGIERKRYVPENDSTYYEDYSPMRVVQRYEEAALDYEEAHNTSKENNMENVNHPDHYNAGGIECIDAIHAALTPEEFRGFCKGNALKYVWREGMKGGSEDLRKAAWYLGHLDATDMPANCKQRANG